MALSTDKSIFLHIPKTSGVWIRHAYKVCKIACSEIGEQHSHFPLLSKYQPPEYYNDRLIYTFVRHPLTWYQSRWAFRVKHGWRAQHPLDYNCASNDFVTFVENALRYKPDGWVTEEFCNYIDSVPRMIDFVGRCEYLVTDMVKVLTLAGETFSENGIRSIPRINDSDMDGHSSKYWAKYTPKLIDRVMAVESEVIRRYYNDYAIDPNTLCGECPY